MFEHTPKPTGSYLKNASAKKDEAGDYWLYISSSEGQAMFCLSDCIDLDSAENATIRRALDAWLAEQDAVDRDSNGKFRSL
jgi:hypothetical protein